MANVTKGQTAAQIQAILNDSSISEVVFEPGTYDKVDNILNFSRDNLVVKFQPGQYQFSKKFDVTGNNVQIIGAGSTLTNIEFVIPKDISRVTVNEQQVNTDDQFIHVGGTKILASASLTSASSKDSKMVDVSSITGFFRGDYVHLYQLNDPQYAAERSDQGPAKKWPDFYTNPNRAIREIITKIDEPPVGNKISIVDQLTYDLAAGSTIEKYKMVTGVTIKGFSVKTIVAGAAAPDKYGIPNRAELAANKEAGNIVPARNSTATIQFDHVADSTISDIFLKNNVSKAFEFRSTYNVQGDSLTATGAYNMGDGGNGYGFSLNETYHANLTNLVAMEMRHSVLFSDISSEHYNTIHVKSTDRNIDFHGSPDSKNTVTVDKLAADYEAKDEPSSSVDTGTNDVHPSVTVEANDVTFKYLRSAWNKDSVTAHKDGADLDGGGGDDTLRSGKGNDILAGGDGSDTVTYFYLPEDNNALTSGVNVDLNITSRQITGGAGSDTLISIENLAGSRFADTLLGNAGDNVLDGRLGADIMQGRAGNDTYVVDNIDDQVIESQQEMDEDVVVTNISYTLTSGQDIEILKVGNEKLDGIYFVGNELRNIIIGSDGRNNLQGGGGSDKLDGRAGDDTFLVDSSDDEVLEGMNGGNDLVVTMTSYDLPTGQYIERLQLATSTGSAAYKLGGNEFDNYLNGNSGDNRLMGLGGSDVLLGKGGMDTFVFNSSLGPSNVDHIMDFSSVDDTMLLDDAKFSALPAGNLSASAFKVISQSSVDADDRILYNQTTGEIFYDSDGSGSGARILFAVLDNSASINAQDFQII